MNISYHQQGRIWRISHNAVTRAFLPFLKNKIFGNVGYLYSLSILYFYLMLVFETKSEKPKQKSHPKIWYNHPVIKKKSLKWVNWCNKIFRETDVQVFNSSAFLLCILKYQAYEDGTIWVTSFALNYTCESAILKSSIHLVLLKLQSKPGKSKQWSTRAFFKFKLSLSNDLSAWKAAHMLLLF